MLWMLGVGYVCLYAYFVVIGFFSPGEVVGFGIAAALIAAGFMVHMARVHHALVDHGHGAHAGLMQKARHQREVRGF
jgi:hypothetical protein